MRPPLRSEFALAVGEQHSEGRGFSTQLREGMFRDDTAGLSSSARLGSDGEALFQVPVPPHGDRMRGHDACITSIRRMCS